MSFILQRNYGFDSNSCVFFDSFASPLPKEFINKSEELIMSFITLLPSYNKNIQTATRLILDYELFFWDTIYKHSIIK